MMKLGEAANRLSKFDVLVPDGVEWALAVANRNFLIRQSTRTAYASAWRQWEAWCRGQDLVPLPTAPEPLAAFLAERADSGLCFGTLDGYCSAIAHDTTKKGCPTRPPTSSYDASAAYCAASLRAI
jgi:hypothetical protein